MKLIFFCPDFETLVTLLVELFQIGLVETRHALSLLMAVRTEMRAK
jgi:hypothetical protein